MGPKIAVARPACAAGRQPTIDRKTITEALTLGHSRVTGSIIPDTFALYWAPPPPTSDPGKARQLLAEVDRGEALI